MPVTESGLGRDFNFAGNDVGLDGVELSDNIIEASWQALVDSFDYAVLRAGRGA